MEHLVTMEYLMIEAATHRGEPELLDIRGIEIPTNGYIMYPYRVTISHRRLEFEFDEGTIDFVVEGNGLKLSLFMDEDNINYNLVE